MITSPAVSNARVSTPPAPRLHTHAVPRHLAIVQECSPAAAPQQFTRSLAITIDSALRHGIRHVSLLVSSAQDVQPAELLAHLAEFIRDNAPDYAASGVCFGGLGESDAASAPLFEALREVPAPERETLSLTLAVNYNGRQELAAAVRELAVEVAAGKIAAAEINQDLLQGRLASNHLPAVDLLVRTANGAALSHFLMWKSAYAELYFTPTAFVNFQNSDLLHALDDYARRRRTFGGLPSV
jgi:undecaprenyl diphosphate synthase